MGDLQAGLTPSDQSVWPAHRAVLIVVKTGNQSERQTRGRDFLPRADGASIDQGERASNGSGVVVVRMIVSDGDRVGRQRRQRVADRSGWGIRNYSRSPVGSQHEAGLPNPGDGKVGILRFRGTAERHQSEKG